MKKLKIRPEYFHFFLYWKWSYYKIRHWGLNCWGSDGSLDTHIYLVTYFICHLLSAIYVSHLSFMTDGMNVRWQITKGTWLIWLSKEPSEPQESQNQNLRKLYIESNILKKLRMELFPFQIHLLYDHSGKKCAGSYIALI